MTWGKGTKIIYTPKKSRMRAPARGVPILPVILTIFTLVLLCFGGYKLLTNPRYMIDALSVTGGTEDTRQRVSQLLSAELQGTVWEFIPKSEYFFVSPKTLMSSIQNNFPEIQSVSIEKKFAKTLIVSFEERLAWGIYCGGIRYSDSDVASTTAESAGDLDGVNCVYIDGGGFAFSPAPYLFGSLTKKVFSDNPDVAIGSSPVSLELLSFYDGIKDIYSEFSLPVTALVVSTESLKDIRLYSGSWYAIFDRQADIGKLKPVIQGLFKNELTGKFDRLEYIDIRFGNKVFYKLKQ